ncbi:15881_t:CDS:2, partial [Funneliformis geosporum]
KMNVNEEMKPILIKENVSLEAYIKYHKTERKLPVSICLIDGKIIAYEVPLSPHRTVVFRIGPNSYYIADVAIQPQDLPKPPAVFRLDGTMAMLAMCYLRTNQNNIVPDNVISFSTAPLHYNTIGVLTNTVMLTLLALGSQQLLTMLLVF